jgi:hypothetical protein
MARLMRKGFDLALSHRCLRPLLGLIASIVLVGCGKPPPPQIVEAEGIVLLDGAPLNHVAVRFVPSIPNDALEYTAVGITEKDGRFKLTCKGEPGACVGENKVLVLEPDLPPKLMGEKAQVALQKYLQSLGNRPLPRQYANFTNNPLVVTVDPQKKSYKLELKR